MKKKLLPIDGAFMEFSAEELEELSISPNDKFEVILQEDGSVKLQKYQKLELDMQDWPRDFLEILIKESCEKDVPVNEILVSILKKELEK